MATTEKIVMYVEGQPIQDPTECFAIRGKTMVDVVNPLTGLTAIYSKTLEDVQADPDYAGAERMTIDEFCQSKAATQDTPITWEPISEARYYELLECLPPIAWNHAGFLVGEPWDHHAMTGRPRYQACRKVGDTYTSSSRPMTMKEWKELTALS